MNYELHTNAKRELGEILNHQLELSQKLGDSEMGKKIRHAKEALSTDSLNVLVMGEFSSGKSTFLNALLGDKIFPSSALPCTGCIAEIQYSDNWTFTLIPKDKNKKSFTIQRSQLKEYTSIDHNDTKLNPYEKLLVSAPMPLCKHGVKLIDSPGLNDPTSHDKTTLEYMPQVDATIFCMDSQHANSLSDCNAINLMRECGHDAIIYVLTKIDLVDEDEVDEVRSHICKKLVPCTSLGKDGIFFLDSKSALKAKMDGNAAMLRKSQLPIFEEALEKILAGEKGRIKLGKICSMIALVNSDSSSKLRAMVENRRSDRKKLTAKLEEAQNPLIQANKAAGRIREKIKEGITEICDHAGMMAGQYQLSLGEKIADWADRTLVPDSLPNDIEESFSTEMKLDMAKWFQSEIVGMITQKIKALQKKIGDEVVIFGNSVSDLKSIFEPKIILEGDSDGGSGENKTDWLSIIGGVSTMGVGGVCGFVSTLLLGPIGLIVAPFAGWLGGSLVERLIKSRQLRNVREEIKSSAPAMLNKGKQQFIDHVKNTVRENLSAWQSTVNEKLEDQIKAAQAKVDDARKTLNQSDDKLAGEEKALSSLLLENDHIGRALKNLRIEYKISAQ